MKVRDELVFAIELFSSWKFFLASKNPKATLIVSTIVKIIRVYFPRLDIWSVLDLVPLNGICRINDKIFWKIFSTTIFLQYIKVSYYISNVNEVSATRIAVEMIDFGFLVWIADFRYHNIISVTVRGLLNISIHLSQSVDMQYTRWLLHW